MEAQPIAASQSRHHRESEPRSRSLGKGTAGAGVVFCCRNSRLVAVGMVSLWLCKIFFCSNYSPQWRAALCTQGFLLWNASRAALSDLLGGRFGGFFERELAQQLALLESDEVLYAATCGPISTSKMR